MASNRITPKSGFVEVHTLSGNGFRRVCLTAGIGPWTPHRDGHLTGRRPFLDMTKAMGVPTDSLTRSLSPVDKLAMICWRPGGGDPEHFEPAGNCAHLTFDGAGMKRSLDRCIDPCAAIVAACLAFCAPLPGCTVIEPLQPSADAPAQESATRPVSGLPTLLHEQTVAEGDIVILRAIAQPEVAGVLPTYVWLQVSGPVVELRGLFTPVSTFIAPVVDGDTLLVFRFFTIVDGTVGT